MNKFEEEKIGVKRFFKNQNINCENFIFLKKDEPCDVYCENTKQQFQVTWNEHSFQAKIHPIITGKLIEQLRSIKDVLDEFILSPTTKKINIYGKSAEGIILLVISSKNFPLNDGYIQEVRDIILRDNNNFFKEIYLVCPTQNIKIF